MFPFLETHIAVVIVLAQWLAVGETKQTKTKQTKQTNKSKWTEAAEVTAVEGVGVVDVPLQLQAQLVGQAGQAGQTGQHHRQQVRAGLLSSQEQGEPQGRPSKTFSAETTPSTSRLPISLHALKPYVCSAFGGAQTETRQQRVVVRGEAKGLADTDKQMDRQRHRHTDRPVTPSLTTSVAFAI